MTVIHTDNLPTAMPELLALIETHTQFSNTDLVVTGPIPRGSMLGTMMQLGWLARTVKCSPDCWNLYCPTPDMHKQAFRFTQQGHAAHAKLLGERVTRGGDR